MPKKTDKQKTFRVGYTLHNYWDIKANDEAEARNLVTCISNRRLAEARGTDLHIDYCDPIIEEE
jgi:hypothetical protein